MLQYVWSVVSSVTYYWAAFIWSPTLIRGNTAIQIFYTQLQSWIKYLRIKNSSKIGLSRSVWCSSYIKPLREKVRFGVILVRIQSEYGKMRTRISPNSDTFLTVTSISIAKIFISLLWKGTIPKCRKISKHFDHRYSIVPCSVKQ